MEPVRHPTKKHIVIESVDAQGFIQYVATLDDAELLRKLGICQWLADERGWTEFVWRAGVLRAELERRKLRIS